MSDSNMLMMMEEKKKLSCCCSAYSIRKRCLKVGIEEENVQLLVSLRKNQYSDTWDQESTEGKTGGSDAFSPIADRIWAHQIPVHVKVLFSNIDLLHWKESAWLYWEIQKKIEFCMVHHIM